MPEKKWFRPETHSGWRHTMPAEERRQLVLDAHGGDYLSAAKSKQALANVTESKPTKKAAKADAKYFFGMHKKIQKEFANTPGADEWNFLEGMKDELEHRDITKGNVPMTAKIVRAHLKDDPRYYTKLKRALN